MPISKIQNHGMGQDIILFMKNLLLYKLSMEQRRLHMFRGDTPQPIYPKSPFFQHDGHFIMLDS